ncbi:hypothetical protein STEG23_009440, partial [Scotinomys teguina]
MYPGSTLPTPKLPGPQKHSEHPKEGASSNRTPGYMSFFTEKASPQHRVISPTNINFNLLTSHLSLLWQNWLSHNVVLLPQTHECCEYVLEIMNPVYSPGSSGVPYANAKGIGYP